MNAMSRAVLYLVLACTCAWVAAAANAQTAYPARPVRIIVPFPPGGGNDLTARLLAQRLQVALGQPFVVENRPGADGAIAFEFVKRSPPDGYTLLLGQSTGMTVNPAVYTKLPYEPLKDFAPISTFGMFPLVIVVNAESELRSFADLVAAARSRPGGLNLGYPTVAFRLSMALLGKEAGFTFNPVPYRGSVPTLNGLLTREIDVAFIDLAAVRGQVQAGRLRAVAVASRAGRDFLPQVPTLEESGVRDFEIEFWSGLFAPAGSPPQVLEKLRYEIAEFLKSDELRTTAQTIGMRPLSLSPDQLRTLIGTQIDRFTRIAREAKISLD